MTGNIHFVLISSLSENYYPSMAHMLTHAIVSHPPPYKASFDKKFEHPKYSSEK